MAFTDDIDWSASVHKIDGLITSGSVTLTGQWTAASPTTGEQSGTAGAGTTTTSMVKPAGAANWTADEMRGWFLRITSGGGSGAIRPILDNDTTTITVHAISGMDNTSVFQISIHDTNYTLTDITVRANTAPIVIENCIITKLTARWCNKLTIRNCKMDTSDAAGSVVVDDTRRIEISECYLENSASIKTSRCNYSDITNIAMEDAWIHCIACNKVTTDLHAENCDATALHLENCLECFVGIEANSNSATPLHMEGCNYMEPYSVGLIGTGNTSDYAIEMEKGGRYHLTSGTMTAATNDLYIEGAAISWANLGTYKNYIRRSVNVLVAA